MQRGSSGPGPGAAVPGDSSAVDAALEGAGAAEGAGEAAGAAEGEAPALAEAADAAPSRDEQEPGGADDVHRAALVEEAAVLAVTPPAGLRSRTKRARRPVVEAMAASPLEVDADAVPAELLAEGSGPVGTPEEGLAVRVHLTADEDVLLADAEVEGAAHASAEDLADLAHVVGVGTELALRGDGPDARFADADVDPDDDDDSDPDASSDEPTDEELAAAGVELPTSAASMDAVQLKHLVEALVFAADKPVTLLRLRQLTRVSDTRRLEQALATIGDDYKDRGIILQVVSGGYQFRTRTQYSAWVQQLIQGRPVRLSRAQLETLAIVAYRQPITRPEIDDIRGVDSSGTLKVLMDRALIRILGKREEVGRPMLYGTTKEFLDFFSLNDLRELPTLREYSELTDESRRVISDRLGTPMDDESPDAPMDFDSVANAYPIDALATDSSDPFSAVDASAIDVASTTVSEAATDVEAAVAAEIPSEPDAIEMADGADEPIEARLDAEREPEAELGDNPEVRGAREPGDDGVGDGDGDEHEHEHGDEHGDEPEPDHGA